MGAVASALRERGAASRAARLVELRATTRPEFPARPVVPKPSGEISEAAASEIQLGRGIAETFERMSVSESTPLARPREVAAAAADADEPPPGVPFDKLWEALVLHAQDPQKWPAEELAKKLSYTGEPDALASTLEHVAAFRVEERAGRLRGVPYGVDMQEIGEITDPAALAAALDEREAAATAAAAHRRI